MKPTTIGPVSLRVFVFLLGLIMTLAAFNKLYTYCSFRYFGTVAYGIIEHPSASRDLGGRPLIQYLDESGNTHEFKSRAKTHWFKTPERGEKIKVFIHGKEPHKAIVDSLFYYVFLPLIFLACGCYCCGYAIFHRKNLDMEKTVEAVL